MTIQNCCGGDGGGGGALELPWLVKAVDYVVQASDLVDGGLLLAVDASGGNRRITVPVDLGTSLESPLLTVLKTDTTANLVIINDGTVDMDAIVSPATAAGKISGFRTIYANGVNLRSTGVG